MALIERTADGRLKATVSEADLRNAALFDLLPKAKTGRLEPKDVPRFLRLFDLRQLAGLGASLHPAGGQMEARTRAEATGIYLHAAVFSAFPEDEIESNVPIRELELMRADAKNIDQRIDPFRKIARDLTVELSEESDVKAAVAGVLSDFKPLFIGEAGGNLLARVRTRHLGRDFEEEYNLFLARQQHPALATVEAPHFIRDRVKMALAVENGMRGGIDPKAYLRSRMYFYRVFGDHFHNQDLDPKRIIIGQGRLSEAGREDIVVLSGLKLETADGKRTFVRASLAGADMVFYHSASRKLWRRVEGFEQRKILQPTAPDALNLSDDLGRRLDESLKGVKLKSKKSIDELGAWLDKSGVPGFYELRDVVDTERYGVFNPLYGIEAGSRYEAAADAWFSKNLAKLRGE
ncbi:MAG: hypothetical protein V1875_08210 [Candidatus Altiarchaeota archaeon]